MHTEMKWPTDQPTEAELQTFEYVLEYGGEGEGAAIVRTYLLGRARYWQLVREVDVDDCGEIVDTGRSRLEFLSHFVDGIFSLDKPRHAWWKLEGLYSPLTCGRTQVASWTHWAETLPAGLTLILKTTATSLPVRLCGLPAPSHVAPWMLSGSQPDQRLCAVCSGA